MNEHEVWTSEPPTVSGWYWFKLEGPNNRFQRPFYATAGKQLMPLESRSAPIPPAEEIAAMREVVEAARLAVDVFDSEQRQRAKYGGPIWRRSREIEAVASAIERLDAARKGGAT